MGWKAKYTLDDMTRTHWNWEESYRGKQKVLTENEKLIKKIKDEFESRFSKDPFMF